MKKIILASSSPRRKELLSGLGIEFTTDTRNNFSEGPEPGVNPHRIPVDMSIGKSHGFHRELSPEEILITADTVVIIDGKMLGKPHSRTQAQEMLSTLSGRTHEVVTAVTIRSCEREETFTDSTEVSFCTLSHEEIDAYIDKFQPYDKAGAYGVQEWIGYVGITSIKGSFYNVMGLPVHKVWKELQSFLLP